MCNAAHIFLTVSEQSAKCEKSMRVCVRVCVQGCVCVRVCVGVRVCVSCHRTVQLNEHKPTGLTCAINGAITVRRKSRIMETKLLDCDGGHLAAAFPG